MITMTKPIMTKPHLTWTAPGIWSGVSGASAVTVLPDSRTGLEKTVDMPSMVMT